MGYHVFDLVTAREIAEGKPVLTLTTVDNVRPLLDDGFVDRDAVPLVSVYEPVIVGRVPIGDGVERYVLIDGYEVAARCVEAGAPLRLRVLSLAEMHLCRIGAECAGPWAEDEGTACRK